METLKDRMFNVHMECVEMGGSRFVQEGNNIEVISSEFTVNEMMNAEQCEYYHNAIWKSEIADYKGKKIRVTEFTIPNTKPELLNKGGK